MEYVMLSDRFGGLNTYLNPDKLGPGGAQEMVGCDVSTGALEGVFFSQEARQPPAFIPKTLLTFNGSSKLYPDRYSFAVFGGILYRAHRGYDWSGLTLPPRGIQYSSDGNTWDILTMPPPAAPTATVAGSGGSVADGTYSYVITYTNALGYESPPSTPLSVTVSAANSVVTLTLPTTVTTGTTSTTTGSEKTVTGVANINVIRTGTRLIANAGIPANTYITSVNYGASSFTISNNATSAGSANVRDAQIARINIYRRGAGITTYLFVDSVSIGTSTYPDNKANTSLGARLAAATSAQLQESVRNIAINSAGTLMGVDSANNVFYFSLANVAGSNPGLYNPAQVIKSPDTVMASIYALDRFIFFTKSRNFSVFLENALDGLPVLKYIEDSESCRLSNNVYPVEYGSRVFWNTSNGIMTTDGNSITALTKYIFKKEENQSFENCYGAVSFNDAIYFYFPEPVTGQGSSGRWVYKFTQEYGWSKIFAIPVPGAGGDGTLGFFDQEGVVCGHGPQPLLSDNVLRFVESWKYRASDGTYWTGEWTGEKHSALKKFRKISALFTGAIEIEVYVDGVALPGKLTANNGTASKRISWWLPSGTKGRAISLRVERLDEDYSIIEELGVWVGEQRGEMP